MNSQEKLGSILACPNKRYLVKSLYKLRRIEKDNLIGDPHIHDNSLNRHLDSLVDDNIIDKKALLDRLVVITDEGYQLSKIVDKLLGHPNTKY